MYKVTVCLLLLYATLITGCAICDDFAFYEVTGQILDAETSEPFEDVRITIDLQRDGVSIDVLSRPTALETDAAGMFAVDILADSQGGLCGFPFPPIPPAEFGPAPNEVQVIVRTESGVGISLTPIDIEDISEIDSYIRRIQLPPIEVIVGTELMNSP